MTEIAFSSIDGDGRWAIDNVSFGTTEVPAVPLPAGLPLLLSGALAFGLMRRRQRS